MLRNNANKAPAPRAVKPVSTQPPPSKPTTHPIIPHNLTQPQYKCFLQTKKFLGSRIDDDAILKKIKQDLSVREIVNALSELSISEKESSISFSKLAVVGNGKEKQVVEYEGIGFGREREKREERHYCLGEMYKFNQYEGNFNPEQYV